MVQQQIVEYAKAQLGLGISDVVIRNALLEAGWAPADVEDSIKSLAAPKKMDVVSSAVRPTVAVGTSAGGASFQTTAIPKTIDVKTIFNATMAKKDLPSATTPASRVASAISSVKPSSASPAASTKLQSRGRFSKILLIILGVLTVAGIGGAIFFFMQVQSLNARIAELEAGAVSANTAVSNLNTQVQEAQGVKATLEGQVATLLESTNDLQTQLSFFVAPPVPSGTVSVASLQFSLTGMLSMDGKLREYAVTTASGLKVFIKNSKDAKVEAALKNLVGQNIKIGGTHAPASRDVTVTSVNGQAIQ